LSQNKKNVVYVVTGRERVVMDEWLGMVPIGVSCEHGCFLKMCPKDPEENTPWENSLADLDLSWRDQVKAILEHYADRTPGSFVESKEVNLTWHFRNADDEFGEHQKRELILHLQDLPNLPIDILPGKKAVEVRPKGINKGAVVKKIMQREPNIDFVLAMGDDKTDEDTYDEVNKQDQVIKYLYTVNVEKKPSSARYYVDNQRSVIDLLTKLAYS